LFIVQKQQRNIIVYFTEATSLTTSAISEAHRQAMSEYMQKECPRSSAALQALRGIAALDSNKSC